MDMFSINWNQRAKNDPVVNYFFEKYVYGGEYIHSNTTDVKIKSQNESKTPKKTDIGEKVAVEKPKKVDLDKKLNKTEKPVEEKKVDLPKVSKEENKKLG